MAALLWHSAGLPYPTDNSTFGHIVTVYGCQRCCQPPSVLLILGRMNGKKHLLVHFVPKADSRVFSSPIASNEFNGIFVGILKMRKI